MSELREAIALALLNWTRERAGCPECPSLALLREEDVPEWMAQADAALAAIDAAGQQIVSKKFSVQPVPGEGLQFKCHFPEGTTVTFSQQGIGGGGGRARGGAEGGPNPRPRSEGQ